MNNFRWSVQNEINNQLNGTTSTPAPTPTPTRISVPLVVTANGLRCRTGPGTQYPILIYKGVPKTFNKGNIITAVGSVNGWWKLDIGGTPGYVFKKYTIERK
jgi:hypothetical protein